MYVNHGTGIRSPILFQRGVVNCIRSIWNVGRLRFGVDWEELAGLSDPLDKDIPRPEVQLDLV